MNTPEREMPKYICHKQVWALKIKSMQYKPNGDCVIIPEDNQYAPFDVSKAYMNKHNPLNGGYYVKYKDGYESYSPAEAFEEGYALIGENLSMPSGGDKLKRPEHQITIEVYNKYVRTDFQSTDHDLVMPPSLENKRKRYLIMKEILEKELHTATECLNAANEQTEEEFQKELDGYTITEGFEDFNPDKFFDKDEFNS